MTCMNDLLPTIEADVRYRAKEAITDALEVARMLSEMSAQWCAVGTGARADFGDAARSLDLLNVRMTELRVLLDTYVRQLGD